MTNAPSYYSVGAAALILGYFSGQFEKSAYICLGFLTLFFLAFANVGYADIGVAPYAMSASHYFMSMVAVSSMWAFGGMLLCRGLNNMKFLNHITLLVTKKRTDQRKVSAGTVWKFWVFLLLAFSSFILYELSVVSYFVRTFLGIGVLLGAWLMFYFLYKDETAYYFSSTQGVTTKNIVFTLTWIPAAILLAYGLIYLLLEFFAQHNYPTTFGLSWFDNHWNFYAALIGAVLPATIGLAMWRGDYKKRTKIGKTLAADEMKEWIQAKPAVSIRMTMPQ